MKIDMDTMKATGTVSEIIQLQMHLLRQQNVDPKNIVMTHEHYYQLQAEVNLLRRYDGGGLPFLEMYMGCMLVVCDTDKLQVVGSADVQSRIDYHKKNPIKELEP